MSNSTRVFSRDEHRSVSKGGTAQCTLVWQDWLTCHTSDAIQHSSRPNDLLALRLCFVGLSFVYTAALHDVESRSLSRSQQVSTYSMFFSTNSMFLI